MAGVCVQFHLAVAPAPPPPLLADFQGYWEWFSYLIPPQTNDTDVPWPETKQFKFPEVFVQHRLCAFFYLNDSSTQEVYLM